MPSPGNCKDPDKSYPRVLIHWRFAAGESQGGPRRHGLRVAVAAGGRHFVAVGVAECVKPRARPGIETVDGPRPRLDSLMGMPSVPVQAPGSYSVHT